MRTSSVLFAYCQGAMFPMADIRRVIILIEHWMSHGEKLEGLTTALSLENRTETLDALHGYGPSLPGIKDWAVYWKKQLTQKPISP